MKPDALPAVCLMGPTASGKSQLALRLAPDYPVALINTDSLQVYCDLPILTARPTPVEEKICPHYLYGFLSAEASFSVAAWLEKAREAYHACRQAGRMPLFVGGTGLYFKALLNGMAPVPPVSPAIRQQVQERLQRHGLPALYQELQAQAPEEAQRLRPQDTARLTRSLEVLLSTGRPLSWWHQQPATPSFLSEGALLFTINPERSGLYHAAEKRLENMFAQGALQEVQALMEKKARQGKDPEETFRALPVSKALGAKSLVGVLKGRLSVQEALTQTQQDTRHYIKRQLTWFRHQFPTSTFLPADTPQASLKILREALEI